MASYWLMKSEPDVFSIDDLKHKKQSLWDGVRNYQARNFMMQQMKVGDLVLFYHSNAVPPGVAGLARICASAVPDPTQFDAKSEYYDAKATVKSPRWFCVKVEFVEKFKNFISLETLKNSPALAEMLVIKKGQRLSIQPVSPTHFKKICQMGQSSQ